MIGYPLDSQVTFDAEGTPIYDRAISSAPLRKLIKKLFSDGVMPNPSTNMQVVVGDSGMTVKVNPGFAIVNGCLKLEETQRTLEIQAASTSYDRIDTVVVRLNDEANARICDLYVRPGTPASSPVRPELVRSGSVFEIGLADIFIPRNTAQIAQQRITDTRYETARCGVISSISQFDTTTLYNQIQSDLAGFKTEEQQAFMDWFENLVYVLDGDVAGHLQNEIVDLQNSVAELNSTLTTQDITSSIGCDFNVSWLVAKKRGNEVNISGGITPHIPLGGNGVLLRNLPTIGTELRWTIGSTLDGTIYPLYVKGNELFTQNGIPSNTRVVFSITYIQ